MDRGAPSDSLPERWAGLGRTHRIALDSVGLWTVELPFRVPVRTARGDHRTRRVALVHLVGRALDTDGETTKGVDGWGECAALADATFDAEDVEGSVAVLGHSMVPALLDQADRSVRSGPRRPLLPPPSELGEIRRTSPHAPLAFAALEMAVADAHLRAERRSLAGLLGVEGRLVELGAVVGQADTTDELLDAVRALVGQGYGRVKLKIGPGWDVEPVSRIAAAFPHLSLQVDANGSYGAGDEALAGDSDRPAGHAELTGRSGVPELAALDRFGLLCIEQPFERSDLAAHADLASRMATPICLDESLDSPRSVEEALALGACSVVCVKPSRLGGLGAALEVVDRCARGGIPLWMGGMFETGYARGVITVLGALDGMAWPGDLSPTRSYLEDDLVPDVPPFRHGAAGALVSSLPSGPGMGPPPDPAALARLGARRQVIDVPDG